jgi:hypothetical protein
VYPVEVAENGLNVCVSGESGVLSTTRVLVPIAFDAEVEPAAGVLPEELHAATPAARATAAMAVRTLGLRDL